MSVSESRSTSPQAQVPVHFEGGFGYAEARHGLVNAELRRQGRETTEPLPDPDYKTADTGFQITVHGQEREYTGREAMRLVRFGAATIQSSVASFTKARAEELNGSFEEDGIEKVDLMGQSAGGLTVLEFARRYPDKVNNIAFIHAPLVKLKNPFHRAPNIVFRRAKAAAGPKQKVATEDIFERRTIKDRIRARKNPNRDTITPHIVALSHQNPVLTDIKGRENAPGVLLVSAIDDPLFTPEGHIAGLDSPDNIDRMLVMGGGHGIKGSKKAMSRILHEMSELDALKQARAAGEPLPPLHERIVFADDVPEKRRQAILEKAYEREYGKQPRQLLARYATLAALSYLNGGLGVSARKRPRRPRPAARAQS